MRIILKHKMMIGSNQTGTTIGITTTLVFLCIMLLLPINVVSLSSSTNDNDDARQQQSLLLLRRTQPLSKSLSELSSVLNTAKNQKVVRIGKLLQQQFQQLHHIEREGRVLGNDDFPKQCKPGCENFVTVITSSTNNVSGSNTVTNNFKAPSDTKENNPILITTATSDDTTKSLKATNNTTTNTCLQGIGKFLTRKFQGVILLIILDIFLVTYGWVVTFQCLANLPTFRDIDCPTFFQTSGKLIQLSILCFFLFPLNLIYGIVTCGRRTIINPGTIGGRITDLKAELLTTLLLNSYTGVDGNVRKLLSFANDTNYDFDTNKQTDVVQTFVNDQLLQAIEFVYNDLNEHYPNDDYDLSELNFHDIARRSLQRTLHGVTLRDVPRMIVEKYQSSSLGSKDNNFMNTSDIDSSNITLQSLIRSFPLEEEYWNSQVSFDFSDDDLFRMTELTESYFEMMDTFGYEDAFGDRYNSSNNRNLLNDALNCTVEEQLSCTTGTIISNFLIFTNSSD